MQARGILNPTDEKFLIQARAKVEAAAPAALVPVPRPWWARLFGEN